MAKRKKRSKDKKADREARKRRAAAKHKGMPEGTEFIDFVSAIQAERGELPSGAVEALGTLFSMSGNWNRFNSVDYKNVASRLAPLDPRFAIPVAAGLLTDSRFQTAKTRLDVFLHLVVAHARGRGRLSLPLLRRCVERDFASLPIRRMEDPPEDVFVSNVIAIGGNYRIFEGGWENADKSLQAVLEALIQSPLSRKLPALTSELIALLRLSDAVVQRAGLERWHIGSSDIPTDDFLPDDLDPAFLASRIMFTWHDLAELNIDPDHLTPFLLGPDQAAGIHDQVLGHTNLERWPLILTDEGLMLANPTGVSPAIRRYVLERCTAAGLLDEFRLHLRRRNSHVLFRTALPRVDAPSHIADNAMARLSISQKGDPRWDEVVCAFDVDKYAIVIMLPDDLSDVDAHGLAVPAFDTKTIEDIADHTQALAGEIATHATGGLILIVFDGIGRGTALGLPNFPPRWYPVVMAGAQFETFAASPDASLLRLWKLQQHIDDAGRGNVEIHESNGTLNTYAFWQAQSYRIVPLQFGFPSKHLGRLMMGIEFIKDIRVIERREHDPHAALLSPGGSAVAVRRYGRTAFFPAMLHRPIYTAEGYINVGTLAGLNENPDVSVWLWADRPKEAGAAAEMTFRIWEALLSWLDRLIPVLIDQRLVVSPARPVANVHIELLRPREWEDIRANLEPEPPALTLDMAEGRVSLAIPAGFTRFLGRAANDGERMLLELVAEALVRVFGSVSAPDLDRIKTVVAATMGGTDTRFIHLLNASSPTDLIAASNSLAVRTPRLLQREDFAASARGLAWTVIDQERGTFISRHGSTSDLLPSPLSEHTDGVLTLRGRDHCLAFYRELVDSLWHQIKIRLAHINGPSLVEMIVQNIEWIHADRQNWRRTARAVTSLYGDADDVGAIAASRENERAEASACNRVVAEMAVATSPTTTGRPASHEDLDALVAATSLLMHIAYDSDAIHGGFAEPEIRIYPNGESESDRIRVESIVAPFVLDTHAADFRAAAASYEDLYADPAAEVGLIEPNPYHEPDFVRAFQSEYGISPARILDALGEFTDIALERSAIVVNMARREVITRLESARGLRADEIDKLFGVLALTPRKRWNYTPPGFSKRDWEPWRYRRRLSLASRPLVVFGTADDSPVVFGLHQLGAGVSYLFDYIRSGWFPDDFFRSEEMRIYRGHVVHRQGIAFGEQVARQLEAWGWQTRTELQMRTLGAPPELGDVDVLAWSAKGHRVLLVECKRLQPARTIAEIVDVLREFQGEADDSLSRHLRRATWVQGNLSRLATVIGHTPRESALIPLLVTNRLVPMRYRSDLPIPPQQIVPFELLRESGFGDIGV